MTILMASSSPRPASAAPARAASPIRDEGNAGGGCLEWRMQASRCFLATVAVLALFNVARSLGLLGPPRYVWASVGLLTVTLALIAWAAGATGADLGLDPADMRAGARYGAGAVGIVLLVLIVAAVLPVTSGFLHDSRARIGGARLLYELGVSILLLTAIPEEFAF